jgi:hypothetical protein
MKKRRPPRPRKRKAPRAVEGKGKVGDLFPSPPSRAAAKGAVSGDARPRMQVSAPVSRPVAERIELANPVPVSAMTNAGGWRIFAGFVISCLLLAGVVVLFAAYWT